MRTEIEYRFGYFLQLERMAKVALATNTALLFTGILMTILGADSLVEEAHNYRSIVLSLFGVIGIFIGTFALVEKIRWVGKLNAWLDKKFWGILSRSNGVLSRVILQSAGSETRETAAQDIFRRLAGEDNIFQFLLDTNIFRLWMWYWISLYGSLTFTLLTIVFFAPLLLTITPVAKMLFTTSWVLALSHIGLGFLLGNYLVRITGSTANVIASSYANEIAGILGAKTMHAQHFVNEG